MSLHERAGITTPFTCFVAAIMRRGSFIARLAWVKLATDSWDEPIHLYRQKMKRNKPWNREETILALDLYFKYRDERLSPDHPEIVDLSDLLNQMAEVFMTNACGRPCVPVAS